MKQAPAHGATLQQVSYILSPPLISLTRHVDLEKHVAGICRGPKDHISITILQTMVSGISRVLALCYVVFGA